MKEHREYLDSINDETILQTVQRKSLSTVAGQVLLALLCLASAVQGRHFEPLLMGTFGFLLVVSIIRFAFSIAALKSPDQIVLGKFGFRLITALTGLGWGTLMADCFYLYGFNDEMTFVVLTVLAGACATATYSLSPAVIASRRFISFALGLPILVLLFAIPQPHPIEATVFLSYWAYLLMQIKAQARYFWRSKYQEQHLLALDRYTLEAIFIHDEGKLLDVNSAFCRMFSVESANVLGQDILDVVNRGSQGPKLDWRGFSLDVPTRWRAVRSNGEEFEVESISRVTKIKGRDVRVVCVNDISVRLQAERTLFESERVIKESLLQREQAALESSKLKADFLANMSHEIRTPLNAIIGITDLLMVDPPSPRHQKYFSSMQASGELLLTIINDVLDFSKIDAGKVELEKIAFGLSQTIEAQAGILEHKAREKRLVFATSLDPQLPPLVEGDPGRIAQVLVNLLGNAIKFTEHGEVSLKVYPALNQPGRITFEVADTGIGISDQDLAKLFSPFTQADTSTARKFGGTGLGLSICKRLIELMGGNLRVHSQVGRGSQFMFTLPLGAVTAPKAEAPATAALAGVPVGGHVLLAEDNLTNKMIASAMLEAAGYTSVAVVNGREVLNELGRNHYDLILMDCQMPEMDGFEATRAIRELEIITGRHIPIIALTANATVEDQRLCFASGMDDYVAKPVHQAKLESVLKKWSTTPPKRQSVA